MGVLRLTPVVIVALSAGESDRIWKPWIQLTSVPCGAPKPTPAQATGLVDIALALQFVLYS